MIANTQRYKYSKDLNLKGIQSDTLFCYNLTDIIAFQLEKVLEVNRKEEKNSFE